jgi:hypothetical protein
MALETYALTSLQGVYDALGVSSYPNPGLLERLINNASRQIMIYAEREFKPFDPAALVRTFRITPRSTTYFSPSEPRSISLVRVDTDGNYATIAAADYQLFSYDVGGYRSISLLNNVVSRRTKPRLEVTGVWGWAIVPDDIKATCEFQVVQWVRRNFQARSDILADDTGAQAVTPYAGLSYGVREFLDVNYSVNKVRV